jgi:hypothetical protein
MKAQQPAEGILKRNDFGDSKFYQIVCGCGQEYHDHNVEVEASETGINVNIYATAKTDYWSETLKKRYDIDSIWLQEIDWVCKDAVNNLVNKIKVTWQLWTKGVVTVETTIAMSEQQALNYAETLKSAVNDVKMFKTGRIEKSAIGKLAEQGDCV